MIRWSTLTFRLPAEGALGLCKQKRERPLLRGLGLHGRRLYTSHWRDWDAIRAASACPTDTGGALSTRPAHPTSEQTSLQRNSLSKYFTCSILANALCRRHVHTLNMFS